MHIERKNIFLWGSFQHAYFTHLHTTDAQYSKDRTIAHDRRPALPGYVTSIAILMKNAMSLEMYLQYGD